MHKIKKIYKIGEYLVLPIAIIIIWQILFKTGIVNPILLPGPERIWNSFINLIKTGTLYKNIGMSILRVIEGFLLAAASGIVIGIFVGLSKHFDRITNIVIQVIRPIPPIAWIPLAILWFGIGENSKVYIIFLGAFFPIFTNVVEGIRQVDKKLVEVACVLEIPKKKLIGKVVIPSALPFIMSGIRIGLSGAWMCVVAAELIASTSGVGYMISDARQLSQTDVVIVGMLIIGIIGKVMDVLLIRLQKNLIRW
ncbi:ABC transporter permease [Clostridium tyrobutyricum]|uniref:ABC transporter permease n=1 Tax=Clostridium tyrobutyricum TaxID=1519 RepID=UPI001C37EDAD|nr:ABC transporter permease [Clostridium tyrobutyricum]MBV4419443.1 ABC transporter permease [Clostridium tyrobutyricum]